MRTIRKRPIGVFDSGLGGLSVVRELQRTLPHEDIMYLGDIARLPYGTKSKKQIVQFSLHNVHFLMSKNIKALVIACNSSSANAYATLKKYIKIPIIDVIRPASHAAVAASHNKRIGVLGTNATIRSQAYQKEIMRTGKNVSVFTQACPLFVPLVEEGWLRDEITRSIIKRYVNPLMKRKVDVLILGCTHYPLLKNAIAAEVGSNVTIIDSGPSASRDLGAELDQRNLRAVRRKKGTLRIFVTDRSPGFIAIGEQFLRQQLKHVSVVRL